MDANNDYYIRNFSNLNHLHHKTESNNPKTPISNKASNSEILNAIHTPNSHIISHQKGSNSKKPPFSVTRFLSNNQKTVNLITGIGIGTLVLGLIYRSLRTTFDPSFPAFPGIPSSSSESPDSTGTCPSIWLPRLGAYSPSTPTNTFLKDPLSRLEELLQNPYRLFKPKSDSPIFIPLEQANQLSPIQDRSQNTAWLLLSKSDLPISPSKQISEFSFSQVTSLLNKHYNLVKGLFSLFSAPNSKSMTSNPGHRLLSATSNMASLKLPQDLSQNLPRILPSNFALQIFNASTPAEEPFYDFSGSNPATEFQDLSIDQTHQKFLPLESKDKISIPISLNRTNGRVRTFRKIHARQKSPFLSRNIYPSFPTNSTLTSKKQHSIATLISENLQKFNLINLKPQDPLPTLKFNYFAKGFTPTRQISSKKDSISVTTEREIKIATTNTTVYQNYISPMISHTIHGYEWTRDKLDSVSEYMRTSLGIPKWFWNILLTPLLKPLKSLPLRRILSYLAPVAVVSYYYGSFLVRMALPTIRRFLPEYIQRKIDRKALEIVNAAPSNSGGSSTLPEPPSAAPTFVVHNGRRLLGNVRAKGYRPGQDLMNSNLFG